MGKEDIIYKKAYSGPDYYIYDGNTYCPECIEEIKEKLPKDNDEDLEQEIEPVFFSETDYPPVCDNCGAFLEGGLTSDGILYLYRSFLKMKDEFPQKEREMYYEYFDPSEIARNKGLSKEEKEQLFDLLEYDKEDLEEYEKKAEYLNLKIKKESSNLKNNIKTQEKIEIESKDGERLVISSFGFKDNIWNLLKKAFNGEAEILLKKADEEIGDEKKEENISYEKWEEIKEKLISISEKFSTHRYLIENFINKNNAEAEDGDLSSKSFQDKLKELVDEIKEENFNVTFDIELEFLRDYYVEQAERQS